MKRALPIHFARVLSFSKRASTQMRTSPNWGGSAFNPDVNVKAGIKTASDNRVRMTQNFPGCTQELYTLMSIGEFNQYGSTQSCTRYNTNYTTAVLDAHHRYAAAAGYAEKAYP